MRIQFVIRKELAKWRDIDAMLGRVDEQPQRFRSGVDAWIAQTYLRLKTPLRELDVQAELGGSFVPGELCVAHRDDLNDFASGAHRCFVVAVRADRPPVYAADRVIVQNDLLPDTARRRYIPHWPQPGLLARDPSRGDRIEMMAYMGRDGAIPAWFRDPDFVRRLAALGVAFEIRQHAWHSYRDVDLVLAVRVDVPSMLRFKPPTKLINAWLAGVPALLGDEPAYRSLRKSENDYLAVATPQQVLDAVLALKADPGRYAAMRANGLGRGAEFSVSEITGRWTEFLLEDAMAACERWSVQRRVAATRALDALRFDAAIAAQKAYAKLFRRKITFDAIGLRGWG